MTKNPEYENRIDNAFSKCIGVHNVNTVCNAFIGSPEYIDAIMYAYARLSSREVSYDRLRHFKTRFMTWLPQPSIVDGRYAGLRA